MTGTTPTAVTPTCCWATATARSRRRSPARLDYGFHDSAAVGRLQRRRQPRRGRRPTCDDGDGRRAAGQRRRHALRPLGPSPPAPYPVSVAAGDVNGDGKPDLVTANVYGDNVSVLLGNGDGRLRELARTTPPAAARRPSSLGDFNGDGKLDVATANGADSSVSVLRGRGDGTFSTAENFAAGPWPSAVGGRRLQRRRLARTSPRPTPARTASRSCSTTGPGRSCRRRPSPSAT